MPAGSAMKVRTTGSSRAMKTARAEPGEEALGALEILRREQTYAPALDEGPPAVDPTA